MTTNYVVKWSSPSCNLGPRCWEKRQKTEWNTTKRIGERSELSGGLGRGKGRRHPFSSPDYCSVHFARRLNFFFSLFSPTTESGPRLLSWDNVQEKSLRHVAMEGKFLNNNKPKTSLKKRICTVPNFIDLIQFLLICQKLAKLCGGES